MVAWADTYASYEPCHSRWSGCRLSTAPECSDSECDQCSWWLDSSTASTSYGSGSRTVSVIGRPMLPTAAVRSPAAVKMAASIWVVVVLPLVPVTPSHGTTLAGWLSLQASSTSLQIGTPRVAAWTSSGAVAGQPVVTTRSASAGSSAVEPGPSLTVPPRVSSRVALSVFAGSA